MTRAATLKPDHDARRRYDVFTEEHEDLRASVRRFVRSELTPHIDEWEETTFPDSVFARLGELGFLGLDKPEELRRAGRRLPLRDGPGRGALLRRQRRPRDGRGRADGHGDAADRGLRHRRAEAGVGRPGDRRAEDPLPRDQRAGCRLRRRGHQDPRGPRRRRLGHQRDQDLHHERRPGRRHRPRGEDRPGGRIRRLHALPGPDGQPGGHPQQAAREARHARVRHGADRVRGRPRPRVGRPRRRRARLLPDHVGAAGRAAERLRGQHRRGAARLRPDARVRPDAQDVRASRSAGTRRSATGWPRWRSSSRPAASSRTRRPGA